jgi:hypothetical protein
MQRYTENTIAKFDDLIRESDPPVQYSVAVDELTVVARTDDPAKFMGHARYVDGETTKVTVKLYHGAGNRNEATELWLKPPRQEASLDGIQQQVLAGIAAERRQWEYDRAMEQVAALTIEVADNEKYIGELEEKLEEYRGKKLHVGNVNLLEVLGFVAEGFVRRNPSVIARLPGGEALAGAIMDDNRERETGADNGDQGPEPAFRRASATAQPQMGEQDAAYLGLIRELGNHFNREEFARVMAIVGELIDNRELLPGVEMFIADTKPAPII